jgi:hypothetical protein
VSPTDDTAPSPLEELVSQALERIEREGPQALEAFLDEHAAHAEKLRKRLKWLVELGFAQSGVEAAPPPARLGDFDLLEPLGQGGMGVVYRAHQRSLGREVALKVVRPEQLLFPGQRERFRREVAVVASLSHPGIVPVYAVGEQNGAPYFAMERVRGATLGQVLDRLAATPVSERSGAHLLDVLDTLGADPSEPASALFDGPWPTVCARIVREAAEALEHAHRRGVLHRDVKPSNLMITRGGRVLLVDFGLASDVDSRIAPAGERLTRTGLRVGTAVYMSPEQLRGERGLDARSDVYSLGVTLYELLSGRLPFDAPSQAQRVAGAPTPLPLDLRRRDPRIARELESVVQAAAAPSREERYASAADFARDLSNVLEGRPVEARRVSAWRTFALWVRRHPAASAAIALALVAPTVVAWREWRARGAIAAKNVEIEAGARELAGALSSVTSERDAKNEALERAQRNLSFASEAIERLLSRVGGEVLVDTPRTAGVRRELLRDALELEERLLAEPAATREQHLAHAATLGRSAGIRAELGEFAAALELLERQARILDEQLAAGPDLELELRRLIVGIRTAEARRLTGDLDTARSLAQSVIDEAERLRPLARDENYVRPVCAAARLELATCLAAKRVAAGRTELLTSAARDLDVLAALPDAPWKVRYDLARTQQELGSSPHTLVGLESKVRDPREDLRWLELALERFEELARERPEASSAARRAAEVRVEMATRRTQLREFDAAQREYEAAVAAFERLIADFPAQVGYYDSLSGALYNSSLLAAMRNEGERRQALLERAEQVLQAVSERAPLTLRQARTRVLVLAQIGDALAKGEPSAAAFERALALGEPLLEQERDGTLRVALAWAASRLAGVRLAAGQTELCAAAAERLAALAARPVDQVWAASWLAQCSAASNASEADALRWRERAFVLLEQLARSGAADATARKELDDPTFEALRSDPRFDALRAAFGDGR